MENDAQASITLDSLPEDALALIFSSLPDRLSRKAFFSTCKALRAHAVAAHVHTLQLNMQDLEYAKEQLQCHPAPAVIRRLWLSFPSCDSRWHQQIVASANLLELLSETFEDGIPGAGKPKLRGLEELVLRDCVVTDHDALTFVAILRARCPRLTSLMIVSTDIPGTLLEGLAEAARSTCSTRLTLQSLHLAASSTSVPLKAATIAKMTGIQCLSLYCTVAGNDLEPLCRLRHLRHLELGPEISPCTKNLGAVLRSCTQLHGLKLSSVPEAPADALVSSSLRHLTVYTLPVTLLPSLVEMRLPNLKALEVEFLSLVVQPDFDAASAAELRASLEAYLGPGTDTEIGTVSGDHGECSAERKEWMQRNRAAFSALPIDWSECAVEVSVDKRSGGGLGMMLDALEPLKHTRVCACQKLLLDPVFMVKGEMSKLAHLRPPAYMKPSITCRGCTHSSPGCVVCTTAVQWLHAQPPCSAKGLSLCCSRLRGPQQMPQRLTCWGKHLPRCRCLLPLPLCCWARPR